MKSDFRNQELRPVVEMPAHTDPVPASTPVDVQISNVRAPSSTDTAHDVPQEVAAPGSSATALETPPVRVVVPARPGRALTRSRSVTAPAREGWQGWINQLGLSLKPSAAEARARADVAAVCANLSRAVTIMVANVDGGAGKTPLSVVTAGSIGTCRGGGVVAWDNNELRGDLGSRTEDGGKTSTVRDLLVDPERHAGRKEVVDRYLRHQAAGQFKVLASTSSGKRMISREEFMEVHGLLTKYYDVLVVDTGNNEAAGNWLALRDVADQLVVPVKWKLTSVNKAIDMMQELVDDGYGHLVEHAVVVGMNGPSDQTRSKDDLATYKAYFRDALGVRIVLDMPTDAHVHADAVIAHDALEATTRRGGNRVAAMGFEHLTTLPARQPHTLASTAPDE